MLCMTTRVVDGAPAPGATSGSDRIKLSWLLKLHWAAIVGQAVAILVVARWSEIRLPTGLLLALVGVETVANAALGVWYRRGSSVRDPLLAGVMLLDTLVLTALLFLSGGHFNPFSTLYLVNVALAAVLLPARWSWLQLGASLAAFGSLFALPELPSRFGVLFPDHAAMMSLHLKGMWVALAVAAGAIVYIVQRVTAELARREQELILARQRSANRDRLASLATLAAGAAHELSTPLSTIAVVAREMERAAGSGPSSEQGADLRLIRQQVDRCRDILQQMGAQAGEHLGEPLVQVPVRAWVEEALDGLPGRERVSVELPEGPGAKTVAGPRRALARALRGLVVNGLQACDPGAKVVVRIHGAADQLVIEVIDRGHGMTPEVLARAGEPFFTTKAPGGGMGLGLFLARALAEQLGGALEIESSPGAGTRARLRLAAARGREPAVA